MNYDPGSKMIVLDEMDLMTGDATGESVIIDPRMPIATRSAKHGTEVIFGTFGTTNNPSTYVTNSAKSILDAKRQAKDESRSTVERVYVEIKSGPLPDECPKGSVLFVRSGSYFYQWVAYPENCDGTWYQGGVDRFMPAQEMHQPWFLMTPPGDDWPKHCRCPIEKARASDAKRQAMP